MIPGFSGPPADPCREGTTWIQWEMVLKLLNGKNLVSPNITELES